VRNNGSVLYPAVYTGTPPGYGDLQWAAGDIRKPSLGLEAKEAIALATAVDLIVHCAAETNFSASSDLHWSVNVEGTRNVVCFARASRGPIPCHSRKPHPGQIRAMSQNQRIIRRDACNPPSGRDVCRQSVQIAAPA
jgi:hypothetical protein